MAGTSILRLGSKWEELLSSVSRPLSSPLLEGTSLWILLLWFVTRWFWKTSRNNIFLDVWQGMGNPRTLGCLSQAYHGDWYHRLRQVLHHLFIFSWTMKIFRCWFNQQRTNLKIFVLDTRYYSSEELQSLGVDHEKLWVPGGGQVDDDRNAAFVTEELYKANVLIWIDNTSSTKAYHVVS